MLSKLERFMNAEEWKLLANRRETEIVAMKSIENSNFC